MYPMISQTLKEAKHLWHTWDIRVLIMLSLVIQILLTLLAPLRKRCPKRRLKFTMWLLYLTADAVALYTIGLISSSLSDDDHANGPAQNADLVAFWAPFLLLHLGGPDTITALALEDNELWHRHALQLVAQVAVTVYVIARSLHQYQYRNKLLLPILLMFVDGCIKYIERICALYLSSMDSFRNSLRQSPVPGPNYALLMEEYSCAAKANIPTEILSKDHHQMSPAPGTSSNMGSSDTTILRQGSQTSEIDDDGHDKREVVIAFEYFSMFKGLLADSILGLKERDESRDFFLNRINSTKRAFRIIEIELNFIYDVFYTKAFLLQPKFRYVRLLCLASVVISLSAFSLMDKSKYHVIDVAITFALIWGALAIDMLAVVIFRMSDWWIVLQTNPSSQQEEATGWSKWPITTTTKFNWWWRHCCQQPIAPPRWSQTISSYNLLNHCFNYKPSSLNKIICIKKVNEFFIGLRYVHRLPVSQQLEDFVMEELKMKAGLATTVDAIHKVCAARGDLVLQDDYFLVSEFLRPWTLDVDYDESVLTWHLATEICFYTEQHHQESNATISTDNTDANIKKHRDISKQLSDYMLYLLLRQPSLMSSVAGMADTRFEDTFAEAQKFLKKLQEQGPKLEKFSEMVAEFCTKILKVKAAVRPITAKGDKSKSVLFDACRLAKQLKMLGKDQWEITSKVWLELLCYAAIRCSPRSHITQLKRGGEFITLLWLLMAHLGLGEHFRQNQGYGWTKLIIYK